MFGTKTCFICRDPQQNTSCSQRPPKKKPQQKQPKVNTSALGKIMVKKMYWANFKWGRKLKERRVHLYKSQ